MKKIEMAKRLSELYGELAKQFEKEEAQGGYYESDYQKKKILLKEIDKLLHEMKFETLV